MPLQDFIQKYYIDPIYQNTGYNIYNTLTYAILLVIAVAFLYRLSRQHNVRIDEKFFLGVLPYIALGGVLRSLEDLSESVTGQLNLFFITPLMYVTVFSIAFMALFFSKMLEHYRKAEYHKTWFSIGVLILAYSVFQIRIANAEALFLVLGIAFAAVSAVFALRHLSKGVKELGALFTKENTLILSVHMFDATTTFVAIQFFDYFEQHVLPSFVISVFGPVSMFFLKFIIVGLVLYYLDKDMKDAEQRNFIKIAIVVLGLGPGLRNFLRMVMGV